MKTEVIPYDSAYWEINTAQQGHSKREGKAKETSTPYRAGQYAPKVKTEVSKTGGSGVKRQLLSQKEFEYCRENRLCFVCKSEGKEIVGSARFHPNHLPTQKQEKPTKPTRVATTSGYETENENEATSVSDSDNETVVYKPKN